MSLKTLVLTRASGTFGTFEVKDGNVTKNSVIILTFFNPATALVPMNARANFTTGDEHQAFDETLMGLSAAGTAIQYVETILKFMDPKARFKDFLDGKLTPASVGLDLTAEELALPSAYNSVTAKFKALFTPPTPPRKFDDRPVTDKLIVRLRQGKPYQISNGDHTIGYVAAKKLWQDHFGPQWETRAATRTDTAITSTYTSASGYSHRYVYIYPTYVKIGCQTIQRNVIEELAIREGWMTA